MKHKLKLWLREVYALVLFYTGLHALVNRMMPQRLTVLFGHCLESPECNGSLPADMKMRAESLTRILDWFQPRYRMLPLAAGMDAVRAGGDRRSVVALTMDDGYRDNATELLPLLKERGICATVFIETGPMDDRRVNWSHKYFWLQSQGTQPEEIARAFLLRTDDAVAAEKMRLALEEGGDLSYQVKRVLKYNADEAERNRVFNELFVEAGGDEAALCEALYMNWDQVRELRDSGFELGAHTLTHEILSRLDAGRQAAEILGSRASLERELGDPGRVFAFPFGRRWDYDDRTLQTVSEAGVEFAVNTHAGTSDGRHAPLEIARIPIDDESKIHHLAAQACGGFDLLKRFGVDIAE